MQVATMFVCRSVVPVGRYPFYLAVFIQLAAVSPRLLCSAEPEPVTIASDEQLYAFDENLLKIELFMDKDAWDKVRFSRRGKKKQKVDGNWITTTSDYEHQPGDVIINGVKIRNVGIRKKGGQGSLSAQRPSLKLKFNKYKKGREFVGIKDLTLNNNKQDPSQIRQYLSYKYFRRVGLPAPRCNLAQVFINGKSLGIYSNVEPIKKEFLKEHFGSSKGSLYESTAHDFQPRAVEQFEAKTNKKTDDKSHLKKVAALLENVETTDIDELSKLVDLEQFLDFWVAEMLLSHWDGYAGNRNNFFVYQNPKTDLFEFLPWGTDQTFDVRMGSRTGQILNPFMSEETPQIIHAKGRLCAALYANPKYRTKYLKFVRRQLKNNWDAPVMLADVNRVAELIRPHIHLQEDGFNEALATLQKYIMGVATRITGELEDPPERWLVTLPEERASSLDLDE